MSYFEIPRLSMCSTVSSLLASKRTPVASSPAQTGEHLRIRPDLHPSIILERTGSTEEMDVALESSATQEQTNPHASRSRC
ncbi:hypothetical protein INR49_029879 [Caranx melampygus]|nr:hypothetical protein INR49_029879 [Caranx melampygus]